MRGVSSVDAESAARMGRDRRRAVLRNTCPLSSDVNLESRLFWVAIVGIRGQLDGHLLYPGVRRCCVVDLAAKISCRWGHYPQRYHQSLRRRAGLLQLCRRGSGMVGA